MYNKIFNPRTNRWVNTDGQIGKQIIKNYLVQLGGATPYLEDSSINLGNIQSEISKAMKRRDRTKIRYLMELRKQLAAKVQQDEEDEINPCEDFSYPKITRNSDCIGKNDFLNANTEIDEGEDGVCLGDSCTTKSSIQRFRTRYMTPPVDMTQTARRNFKRKGYGDMLDSDMRLWTKYDFDKAGIPEPESDEYADGKEILLNVHSQGTTSQERKMKRANIQSIKQTRGRNLGSIFNKPTACKNLIEDDCYKHPGCDWKIQGTNPNPRCVRK